jgi:hypothetical protein
MAKKPQTPADYLAQLPESRRAIIERLRAILVDKIPDYQETMAWGVLCYNDLFYLANLPKQVTMGFSILGLTPAEIKQFQGGGKTMRHLKFNSVEGIDEKKVELLIDLVKTKAKPVSK